MNGDAVAETSERARARAASEADAAARTNSSASTCAGRTTNRCVRRTKRSRSYEEAVEARFDAAGPYDRLIAIYHERDQMADVARIAAAAVENVRTFDDKRAWYESMRDGAPMHRPGAEF